MSKTNAILWIPVLAFAVMSIGCADDGNVIELHFQSEPMSPARVEFLIDKRNGIAPKKIGPNRYRFDVVDGKTITIPSESLITNWHQWLLITPTRTMSIGDFTTEGGWISARDTRKLPDGGVQTTSRIDGSRYWIEFTLLEERKQNVPGQE
jgi:hypothetical protein